MTTKTDAYYIHIWQNGESTWWELSPEFEPEPCQFDGFEDFEFVSHRQSAYYEGRPKTEVHANPLWWGVSELRTGFGLFKEQAAISRSEAETIAADILRRHGVENLRKLISDTEKQYGLSPRYGVAE